MLQALGVALHPKLNVSGAMIAIQNDLVSKMFEVNFVAVSAAVQTKKQNHRAPHGGGHQHRTGRERSVRAEELTLRCLVAARDAVA